MLYLALATLAVYLFVKIGCWILDVPSDPLPPEKKEYRWEKVYFEDYLGTGYYWKKVKIKK